VPAINLASVEPGNEIIVILEIRPTPRLPQGICPAKEFQMKSDPVKQFLALRTTLAQEKERLRARLVEIQRALAAGSISAKAASRPRRASAKNPMSLKQAVVRVTLKKPMKKEEILRAVRKEGYRFSGKDPMNSLNVALYTRGNFRNQNGLFSPYKQ
jgi:hypothetical protein